VGRGDEARRLLQLPLGPGARALVHIGLGEAEAALVALEDALRERRRILMWLKVEPRFRPLHGHPRYQALLAAVGLASSP
jgi:hypothetical protein